MNRWITFPVPICGALLSLFFAWPLPAQELLDRGTELLARNRPLEARPLLEQALQSAPTNEEIYLHLAIAYEQLAHHRQAIDLLNEGLAHANHYVEIFYLNIANNLVALKELAAAHNSYNRALEIDAGLATAYLNRANLRVTLDLYPDAIEDYTAYLDLRSAAPQESQIRQMVALLQEKMNEAERLRIEEERRRQALLDSVLDSLSSASGDTQGIKVDREEIVDFEDELEIAE